MGAAPGRRAGADRVRTVDRVDGPSGSLVVDFPYEDAPVAGEWVELHHLHPDQQLRTDVLAGLRRCYLLDSFEVPPPVGAYANGYANGNGYGARAVIREVTTGTAPGWCCRSRRAGRRSCRPSRSRRCSPAGPRWPT